MEADNTLLLSLLAVRMLGGQTVPTASALLKPFSKTGILQAKEKGLLKQDTVKLPSTNKAGKTTMKNTPVYNLTPEGEQFLQQSASAEAIAATNAAHLAAVRQSLDADKRALREQVLASLAAKGKNKPDAAPAKKLDALAKQVENLSKKLQELESTVRGQESPTEDGILTRIDQAFATLAARLDKAFKDQPVVPPPLRPDSPPPPPPDRPTSLRAAMREAYERLTCFREFQDGMVDAPRLYHETRRVLPQLTSEEYRRELEALWDGQVIRLHALNEVREAIEPDKAVRRDDNLYYFITWPSP